MRTFFIFFVCCMTVITGFCVSPPIFQSVLSRCQACHDANGQGTQPVFPNLGGQHATYLYQSMKAYQSGARQSPVMGAILTGISDEILLQFSEYYARMPIIHGATPYQYVKRGERLYRGGDRRRGIPACMACHGPSGLGIASSQFPVLSGQQPLYTLSGLTAYTKHERKGQHAKWMRTIAKRLSEKDKKALAYYLLGLHE
jgi:cytochrome c553